MAIVSNNVYDDDTGLRVNADPIVAGAPFTLTGLASGVEYNLTATNVDAAGNESDQSDVFSFTTGIYEPPPPPLDEPLSAPDQAAVDAICALTYTSIPGMLVATSGPRGYYAKAYGKVAPAGLGDRLLTVDDHVRIGSLTKTFTAMAFWQAVDDGLVHLSDHLEDYVPGVPLGSTITLEQVITMRSGVYEYTSDWGVLLTILLNPTGSYSQAQALALIKGNGSSFTPGSKYAYANSNAILIRAVVEAVRPGRSFPTILKEDIFDPLGLTETAWPTSVAIPEPAASPGQFNPELAGAAGALTSTIGDLTKWAQACANGDLISGDSWDTWTTGFPSVVANPGEKPPTNFSYGHFLFKFGDWYGHDGSISGYGSGMVFDPVTGATISVVANLATSDAFYKYLRNIAAYLYPDSLT